MSGKAKNIKIICNYFTEEKCEDDSILNDKDIIRKLYEICDQLKNIVPDKIKKSEFIWYINIVKTSLIKVSYLDQQDTI